MKPEFEIPKTITNEYTFTWYEKEGDKYEEKSLQVDAIYNLDKVERGVENEKNTKNI